VADEAGPSFPKVSTEACVSMAAPNVDPGNECGRTDRQTKQQTCHFVAQIIPRNMNVFWNAESLWARLLTSSFTSDNHSSRKTTCSNSPALNGQLVI